MIYSTIKTDSFTLDDLQPDSPYNLKVRSVNKSGVSDWVPLQGKTKANPLLWTIRGAVAETNVETQEDYNVQKPGGWRRIHRMVLQIQQKKFADFDVVVDLKIIQPNR